jgi:hypothetical protein
VSFQTRSNRKLQVQRLRLREKGAGTGKEGEIPAYAAMHNQPRLSARMLDIPMRGVSTRQYQAVIPEMVDTVGVSKSSVSRQIIEASEAEVEALLNRRLEDVKPVAIYIDCMAFGDHVTIGAVGVDAEGHKHVLAICEGATENATLTKAAISRCSGVERTNCATWSIAGLLLRLIQRGTPYRAVDELDDHYAEYRLANRFARFDGGLNAIPHIPNADGEALLFTGSDNDRDPLKGDYFGF